LAKHATKRNNFVVFQNAFHGRTHACASMTTSKTTVKQGLSPLPGVYVAPQFPSKPSMVESALDNLNLFFKQIVPSDEVAAIIIEPVQGEGGYIPAPTEFLQGLRDLCNKKGILLVFDEIQTGMGRTCTKDNYFAMQHHNVEPDIVIIAKGIANGMPLSLIASRTELTAKQHAGAMGGTYSGNPLACAAGVAVLDVFKEENVLANAAERAKQLTDYLNSLDKQSLGITDVRGLGLMVGVEFDSKNTGIAQKICNEALANDLFLMTAGAKETIRFMPPLNVTEAEMDLGISLFNAALEKTILTAPQQQQQSGSVQPVQPIVNDEKTFVPPVQKEKKEKKRIYA